MDVGVYVSYQIVYFEIFVVRNCWFWVMGINMVFLNDIVVYWVGNGSGDFYVCFLVVYWWYWYVIFNYLVWFGIQRGQVSWIFWLLNEVKMYEVVQVLVGEYDFLVFCVVGCQLCILVCFLECILVICKGDFVVIDVQVNVFFYYMVCNIVGVLMVVGLEQQLFGWICEIFGLRDWILVGVIVLFYGLYLVDVGYFECFKIFFVECGFGFFRFWFGWEENKLIQLMYIYLK